MHVAKYKNKSSCSTILEVTIYLIGMLYLKILSTADFIHTFSIFVKNSNPGIPSNSMK